MKEQNTNLTKKELLDCQIALTEIIRFYYDLKELPLMVSMQKTLTKINTLLRGE